MSGYRLTSRAETDLFAIWAYIARDSIDSADRVEHAIYSACAFLAENSLAGHRRSDLTNLPVLFWAVVKYPRYVIVYNPTTRPLEIVRILHGARDVKGELQT
jgi:antitoxin ParD1/3/4/toxin ParE1/3/4